MRTQRVDEHRVGVLVPEHYKFLDVIDLYAGAEKDDVAALVSQSQVPARWVGFAQRQLYKVRKYQRHAIGDRPALSQCNICGAHIRYAVVWSYRPVTSDIEHGIITTGVDCAESMGSAQISEIAAQAGALKEFVAGMRRVAREAEVAAARDASTAAANRWSAVDRTRRAWLDASPRHRRASDFLYRTVQDHVAAGCVGPTGCFYCSVAEDIVTLGKLSDRQVTAVLKSYGNSTPAPVLPIPYGITTVTGKLVSAKSGRMLIQCNGYRVWTIPPEGLRNAQTGSEVRFTANLEPSTKDPKFLIAHDVRDGEVVG